MAERTVEGALLISAFGYVHENDVPRASFLVLWSSGRPPTKVAVKSHVEHPVAAEPDADGPHTNQASTVVFFSPDPILRRRDGTREKWRGKQCGVADDGGRIRLPLISVELLVMHPSPS